MPQGHFLVFLPKLNCFEILNIYIINRNIELISNIWKIFSAEQSTFSQKKNLVFFLASKNYNHLKICNLEMRYCCKTKSEVMVRFCRFQNGLIVHSRAKIDLSRSSRRWEGQNSFLEIVILDSKSKWQKCQSRILH